jgi:Ni,Fe-hydrogenase maturation factor
MRWAGYVARKRARRDTYMVMVERLEGDNLDKHRRRWKGNIKWDFQTAGLGGMDCIDLVQDMDRWLAIVDAVMNFRVS